MDWPSHIRKYVWDDTRTPYFVPSDRLSRTQADHELFSYTFFMGLLFAAISIISLTDNAVYGRSVAVALYALSVSAAAVLFGLTKSVGAARYLALAPAAALASLCYVFLAGFAEELAAADKLLIIVVALGLLRYSMRVVAIARLYPGLPENAADG